MKGKVKWFKKDKGYGFLIEHETNREIFVHYLSIDSFNKNLKEGQEVTFEISEGRKGIEAVNVRKSGLFWFL